MSDEADRMNAVAAAWRSRLAEVGERILREAKAATPLAGGRYRARYAELEAEKTERAQRLTAELAEASADWHALRDRVPHPAAAVTAVLIIHRPWATFDGHIGCTECVEAASPEDIRNVDWPCDTYKAIKENTPS